MPEKNKNTPRIILYILVVVVLIAIAYFLFFFKWPGDSPLGVLINNVKTVNNIVKDNLPVEEGKTEIKDTKPVDNSPVPSDKEKDENMAVKIASAFTERFGSYSNQSDYGNITDLFSFMTYKMKIWANQYVSDAREKYSSTDAYYGVTTKAISSKVQNFDEQAGTVEILVSTQRAETFGDGVVYYEDIIIEMIKERNDWKIDSAFWQGRK